MQAPAHRPAPPQASLRLGDHVHCLVAAITEGPVLGVAARAEVEVLGAVRGGLSHKGPKGCAVGLKQRGEGRQEGGQRHHHGSGLMKEGGGPACWGLHSYISPYGQLSL